jgi:hypothetical protein
MIKVNPPEDRDGPNAHGIIYARVHIRGWI